MNIKLRQFINFSSCDTMSLHSFSVNLLVMTRATEIIRLLQHSLYFELNRSGILMKFAQFYTQNTVLFFSLAPCIICCVHIFKLSNHNNVQTKMFHANKIEIERSSFRKLILHDQNVFCSSKSSLC